MNTPGELLANFLTAVSYFWISGLVLYFLLTSKLIHALKSEQWGRGCRSPFVLTVTTVLLFVAFVFFCGLTHLVKPLSMYNEAARVVMLFICCTISMLTAVVATFVLPTLKNITDKLELTEEGLAQKVHSDMMAVIDACQESIVVMASDGSIICANRCTKYFFGTKFSTSSLLSLVHEEDRDNLILGFKSAIRAETHEMHSVDCGDVELAVATDRVRVEYRVKDYCGEWTWIESTLMISGVDAFFNAEEVGETDIFFTMPLQPDLEPCVFCRPARLMMVSRNINVKKREEELHAHEKQTRQKEIENAAKLNYITSCAHDLKTPLQSFNYAIDLLSKTPLQLDQLDILHQAHISALMLNMTISQTMDSSKVLMGDKLVPRKGTIVISEIICRVGIVIDSYSRLVPICFLLRARIFDSIITDEDWLWQMILNYLTNACKYTERGSINFEVNLWSQVVEKSKYCPHDLRPIDESGTDFLLFQCTDSGIGIAKTNISALFNTFSVAQVGQATGTGMGLYGVKIRAEGLNGFCGTQDRKIFDGVNGSVFWFMIPYLPDNSSVDAENGFHLSELANKSHFERHGSLFVDMQQSRDGLTMSLRPTHHPMTGKPSPPSAVALNLVAAPRYLAESTSDSTENNNFELSAFVVDDVSSIRKLLTRTLQTLGFKRIDSFENGSEAFEAMKTRQVDIVFMDIQMPIMSGPEAVSRLRAFEKETGRKKRQLVIASSANFSSSDLVDLIGDDMFDVIPKPVMISDLKRVMVEYHFDLRL